MTIDIIGAGIGGLTTAIALEQKGIKSRIFEQAEHIKEVGAGIILANNAVQVYNKLGLRNVIEENGNIISSMNINKSNLKPLSKMDLTFFEQKHNTINIAIHRGKLQQILIDKLNSTEIILDHKLASITKRENGYNLNFKNGNLVQPSTVSGADGLNSVARQKIFSNNSIRSANQICWRGVTEFELPLKFRNELNEAWGKSERSGFIQISENKVYWYALKSFQKNKEEFSISDLYNKYFSSYCSIIKDMMNSTKKEQINTTEIIDLKSINIWHKDNACFMGDSAHATTSNMGQGACQAIEDAYVLSESLNKHKVAKAFSEYQKLRLPKAHQVAKTSWIIGKMAHLSNPILIVLRNQILRLTPTSFKGKQNEQIFQLAKI